MCVFYNNICTNIQFYLTLTHRHSCKFYHYNINSVCAWWSSTYAIFEVSCSTLIIMGCLCKLCTYNFKREKTEAPWYFCCSVSLWFGLCWTNTDTSKGSHLCIYMYMQIIVLCIEKVSPAPVLSLLQCWQSSTWLNVLHLSSVITYSRVSLTKHLNINRCACFIFWALALKKTSAPSWFFACKMLHGGYSRLKHWTGLKCFLEVVCETCLITPESNFIPWYKGKKLWLVVQIEEIAFTKLKKKRELLIVTLILLYLIIINQCLSIKRSRNRFYMFCYLIRDFNYSVLLLQTFSIILHCILYVRDPCEILSLYYSNLPQKVCQVNWIPTVEKLVSRRCAIERKEL